MKREIHNLVLRHNNFIDGLYIPQDLNVYVDKIMKNAIIITYNYEGELKGFIAFYANSPNRRAFLSLILVDKNSQGKNIGKFLLESSIRDLRNKKFVSYSLEVLKKNTKAISLYKNFGFEIQEDRKTFWLMNLDI
jgi:ribosomal protein S18 acetylase RimI-like enzyme